MKYLDTLMLIDDNSHDLEVYKKLIQTNPEPVEVIEAKTGTEALRLIKHFKPNCILLDYLLPDMTGIEFLRELKACNKGTLPYPIIVITGQGDETIATEFLKQGASDYLVKNTITESSFFQSINNAIEKYRLENIVTEKQRDLYDFSHTVAHDLKAPLNRIIMYLDLMENNLFHDPQKCLKYLNNIRNDTYYAVYFINSLLEYAEVGRSQKPFEKVNLDETLDRALRNLESDIASKKAVIIKTPLTSIMGDKTGLTQLFQNLISNALKFQKTKNPVVEIKKEHDNSYEFCFSVQDNGIGIPLNRLNKIFEPFSKLHSLNKFRGSGIGLATCKTIIDHHKGRLFVKSVEGRGSKFIVHIPK